MDEVQPCCSILFIAPDKQNIMPVREQHYFLPNDTHTCLRTRGLQAAHLSHRLSRRREKQFAKFLLNQGSDKFMIIENTKISLRTQVKEDHCREPKVKL